jgi:superfamily II DNA or RNA helicase
MTVQEYLFTHHFTQNGYFQYGNPNDSNGRIILSTSFVKLDTLVIIDHVSVFNTNFSYRRYCQKQNEWMQAYKKVYRFIETDLEMVELFLSTEKESGSQFDRNDLLEDSVDYIASRTYNREEHSIDPSPLEYFFEDRFADCYGEEALSHLSREYSMILMNGKTGYLDYVLIHQDGRIFGIEENGVSYHHPFLIKQNKYRNILMKQNSLISQGGKMYRWDTESILNPGKVNDEIREFFGELANYKIQTSLASNRKFQLYHHQNESLKGLRFRRDESGKNASLVVLPTGTGKTQIALEDISYYQKRLLKMNVLVLVPSRALKKQWIRKFEEYKGFDGNVKVRTYAGSSRRYQQESSETYDYMIVDEAHHAVAPTLKKVIRHYQPSFLLGLTATDQRLDEKRLDDVFGKYDVQMDLKEAMEKGILCPVRAYRLETNVDLSKVRFNQNDYYAADLRKNILVPSRDQLIADTVKKYFGERLCDKSGIVFCVNIQHAKDMASLLNDRGISASSVDGKDTKRFEKIDQYMKKEIRFLCTCSLLTEGWDAPHTSVIVMARPTLSRVLYAQQLGRGTRKAPGKEALYVIDVVDNYGAYGRITNRPWSFHSLLGFPYYRPFGGLPNPDERFLEMDTIYEKEMKLAPIDIFTMQQLYSEHLGEEQLARELFVSTGTVKSWIQKGKIIPDVNIPMGRSHLCLFAKNQVSKIREKMGLKEHTEETIVKDFWEFIEKGDYSFSYKMPFVLAVLEEVDSVGEADVDRVFSRYQNFYMTRLNRKLQVDRTKSPYNRGEMLRDDKLLKRSMLQNPFEKFERKKFMYHAKDLKRFSIHHRIWNDLIDNHGLVRLRDKMEVDLKQYYQSL